MSIIKNSLTLLVISVFCTSVSAQEYPSPTGFVNDFANILSAEQGKDLNEKLVEFKKQTGAEIAVVTVPSLGGQTVEAYTRGLATEWKVGKQGKNNGVIFLVAPAERKMRIETASGIKDILTNRICDQIRDGTILPKFKAGDIPGGIISGTQEMMAVISQPPPNNAVVNKSEPNWGRIFLVTAAFVGLLFGIPTFLCRRANIAKAREYVRTNLDGLEKNYSRAQELSKNPDISQSNRSALNELAKEFNVFTAQVRETQKIDWPKAQELFKDFSACLAKIAYQMQEEVSRANKARTEGPKLLADLPNLIAETESKLLEGKQSEKARKHLNSAKDHYEQARSQASGMSTMDWIILYTLLSSAKSDVQAASSSHRTANSPASAGISGSYDSPRTNSSSSSDSDSGYGFGSLGGFGGGGGFGSSGGGSSGSW